MPARTPPRASARPAHRPPPSPTGSVSPLRSSTPPVPTGPSVPSAKDDADSDRVFLVKGYWHYGRYYGTWRKDKYIFPIDSEELNRMDIFHKFFLVARKGVLHKYALRTDRRPRILDLGTGTGIWAINVIEDIPQAEVMTVDLNQIQPPMIPRGMTPLQFDIEEPSWDPLLRDCDMIHARMLLGCIENDSWPKIYKRAFEHLTPGYGYFEQVDIDWTPYWTGADRPAHSAIKEWSGRFLDGLDRAKKSARVNSERTKRLLREAGFSDIQEEKIRCYLNPWSTVKHERDIARWFNLGICQGLEAMSLMPMVDFGSLDQEQTRALCSRAREEMCVMKYQAFMTMYIWTARRAPRINSRITS